MGSKATYPELLDYLASDLVRQGWKLKSRHRLIVTSATYRQASIADSNPTETPALRLDPDNRLLWRPQPPSRCRVVAGCAAASLRPAQQAQLARNAQPELPDPLNENRYAWYPDEVEEDRNRRSIYVIARRNLPYPLLGAFDTPDRVNSFAVRPVSTCAPQALTLLNSKFAITQARHFAGKLLEAHGGDLTALVRKVHLMAYSREPTSEELSASMRFLDPQSHLITAAIRGHCLHRRFQACVPRWPVLLWIFVIR